MAAIQSERTEEQVVVFLLGRESYGIDIFRVNEIIRLREITPVPRTDYHIRGLVNLRGKTIPVVDFRTRLGMAGTEDGETTRIIVVDTENGHVGMVVDAVSEVITLFNHEIEETPPLVAGVSTDFVRGVAKRDGLLITMLDLDKALAS